MKYKKQIPLNNVICTYIVNTFALMLPMCALVYGLNISNRPIYGSALGIIALGIGGLSSAFAGVFTAKKFGIIEHYRTLLKDFFRVKQPIVCYLAIVGFLLVLFAPRILQGQMQTGKSWFDLPLFFLIAILFGGVEEIGWRYLLGPVLESRFSFGLSSMIVTCLWAVWHIMFFVVDGSILAMLPQDIGVFVISLFGTSFVLGAIFRNTQSLWLCVFYHALLNAFTQIFIPVSIIGTIVISAVCILLSLIIVTLNKKQSDKK